MYRKCTAPDFAWGITRHVRTHIEYVAFGEAIVVAARGQCRDKSSHGAAELAAARRSDAARSMIELGRLRSDPPRAPWPSSAIARMLRSKPGFRVIGRSRAACLFVCFRTRRATSSRRIGVDLQRPRNKCSASRMRRLSRTHRAEAHARGGLIMKDRL